MIRGRLIRPFLVVIQRLDTVATRAETPGYDDAFRSPHVVEGESGERVEVRAEDEISVRAQIEDRSIEHLRQMRSGDSPTSQMGLTIHFSDLEQAGLVDADGVAAIHKNDRLVEIREVCTPNRLVQSFRSPPGLYVTEATPAAFGLGLKRNLLLVTLEHRDTGSSA